MYYDLIRFTFQYNYFSTTKGLKPFYINPSALASGCNLVCACIYLIPKIAYNIGSKKYKLLSA